MHFVFYAFIVYSVVVCARFFSLPCLDLLRVLFALTHIIYLVLIHGCSSLQLLGREHGADSVL